MAEAAERKQEAVCPNAALQARAEQVRLLYRYPIQLSTNVVIAAIVGAVLWRVYPPTPLLAWFSLMAVVTLLRLGLCKRYDRAQPPADEVEGWGRLFALGAGVTGCLWGACASVVWVVDQIPYHVFAAFVAAGMGAGAVAAGSTYLPAVNVFLLTSLAPLALTFAIQGQLVYLAMGTMVALFGILMSRVARNLNGSLAATFKLQADNAVLIEQLSTARNSLELRVQEKTAELGESEERYRRLVEQSPSGIFVNLDGKIAFANPAAVALLGAGSADDLAGKPILDFVHPDFKDAVRARTEYAAEKSGTPPPMEQLYVGLDGRVFHVEATATPIMYRGKNAVLSVFRDISERKRSEQALRENRDQLRLITDNLPVLISYIDRDQRYRFANRLHERWFERPLAEILGRHAKEVLEPAVYERLRPNIEKALEGESQGFEVTTQPTDVPPGHFRVNFVPHIGDDGAVQGFFALVRSITRYKAAETAIRESEAQLRLVTDNLPVLISYVDDQQRFRFVNKACEAWYGRSEAELLGRQVEEIHGANYGKFRPFIERALAGELTTFEETPGYPDGKTRDVQVMYIPHVDEGGQVLGFFALVQDITERKRAEEAVRTRDAWLRAIMENAPIQIVLKDTEGHIMAISRNVAEDLGLAMEEFIGRTTADFLPVEIADVYMAADRKVMASGRPLQQEVTEELDGSATHFLSAKFPLRDDNGRIVGICSLTSDITEMKAMQAQLNQAQKMEAVGQLTGGVAHDFNNLLAIIMSNAEILQTRLGQQDPLTRAVIRAAERGSELTQRLLAFSRQQSLDPQVIDLDALVANMTGILGRTLGAEIEIKTEPAKELWPALADPGQMENALLNLAINARDAMPQGGKLTIEIANAHLDRRYAAAHAEVEPGDYVVMAVGDTGHGMAPKVLTHVFEPFFTTKEVGRGTGLGLSMVYGFIKQSNGHIVIDSKESLGTTVKLYLPRAETGNERAQIRRPPIPEDPAARGEAVLVVEDEFEVRQSTVALLEALGYRVLQAPDGESALAAMDQSPRIDLLLSDVVLPGGMSGPDLAAEVRRRETGIKVLFMSGYAEAAARGDGLDGLDGLDGHGTELLNKPFRKSDLARKVRAALDP